ncbi:hypothetical protein BDA96_04G082100 [Sorghum bicolor]|uniref:Knottin scorpion toxin-like domain-containing protein n=2 Tax=Sorghum bicolor TaxID=4558 RepID=A0A921R469_SORBI|nr:hypothetical protein BDA96_04G082100 [Sorghum bicolor]OQU84549.1 hypothetical protein SORBI_3004G075301 [Sorghum bicolor]
MASSGKNLSATLLLIIIVAAVCPLCSMARDNCEQKECRHLSGSYQGPCLGFIWETCSDVCQAESTNNAYGDCGCDFKCWCYTCMS